MLERLHDNHQEKKMPCETFSKYFILSKIPVAVATVILAKQQMSQTFSISN